jgi:hypothetical protein
MDRSRRLDINAALIKPRRVVVEAAVVIFIVVDDVKTIGVDLEAPDRGGVVDADVPRRLDRQIRVDREIAGAPVLLGQATRVATANIGGPSYWASLWWRGVLLQSAANTNTRHGVDVIIALRQLADKKINDFAGASSDPTDWKELCLYIDVTSAECLTRPVVRLSLPNQRMWSRRKSGTGYLTRPTRERHAGYRWQ